MIHSLDVALALYRTNRVVNHVTAPTKALIYTYKTAALRQLTLDHKVTSWAIETIEHECWHTQAFNDGIVETCSRCNGSNVFRVEYQVRFYLVVDDREFWFHQPIDQVDWMDALKTIPVDAALDIPDWYIRDKGAFVTDMNILQVYTCHPTVYVPVEHDRTSLPSWYRWE